jgi:hypothetical protein
MEGPGLSEAFRHTVQTALTKSRLQALPRRSNVTSAYWDTLSPPPNPVPTCPIATRPQSSNPLIHKGRSPSPLEPHLQYIGWAE